MTASTSRIFIMEEDDNEYFYVRHRDGSRERERETSWIETQYSYSDLNAPSTKTHNPERCYVYSSKASAGCMYVDKTPHIIGGSENWLIKIMTGSGFNGSFYNRLSYGVPFTAVCNLFKLQEGKHPDLELNVIEEEGNITYTIGSEAWVKCSMKLCACLHEPRLHEAQPVFVYNESTVGIYYGGDAESLVLFQRVTHI